MTISSKSRFLAVLLMSVSIGSVPSHPLQAGDASPVRRLDTTDMDPDELKTLATSNQLVFVPTKKGLEPVCRCGPKVLYADISPFVVKALVAIEDHRFYLHTGVDPYAMLRAVSRYVASGFSNLEGGSTITQQLVKNTILSSDKSFDRKLLEQRLAVKLETVMSKRDILEAYLNQMIFGYWNGRPVVGIEQAARVHFGRSAKDLDLIESAMIVGMLKSPAAYDPSIHPDAARARAKVVLAAMANVGMVSKKDVDRALAGQRVSGRLKPINAETRGFTQWVLSDISASAANFAPTASTHIPLTLQVVTQNNAEKALFSALERHRTTVGIDGAYLVMSLEGKVLAMVGQRNFTAQNLNFATQTRRPPASSFKPIVFTAALEAGLLKTTREARHLTAISNNEFAERIFASVGVERVVNMAVRLGIRSRLRQDFNLALGGSEVSLLDMVAAYQTIANNGLHGSPAGYYGITDAGRRLSWNRFYTKRVISATVASDIKSLLRAVVDSPEGTGHAARTVAGAFGKTGTSDNNRDAWFIGSTARRVSGLWLGRPDNKPMDSSITGAFAASVWAAIDTSLLP